MSNDEQILDTFLLKAKQGNVSPDTTEQTTQTFDVPPPTETPEENTVEEKARQGKPMPATVLQNKSVLSDQQLEKNIAATLRKYPDKIDEAELRKAVAAKLEEKGEISEADYQKIVNQLLSKKEKEQQGKQTSGVPSLSPPDGVTNAIDNAQKGVSRFADWAGSLSTPGGIGFLVAVLMFFIWVVVPINASGKTRMQLLFGILTGQVDFVNSGVDVGTFGGDTTSDTPQTSTTTVAVATTMPLVSTNYTPSFEDL